VSNLRVSESEPTGSNAQDGLLRSDSAIRPAARRRDAQIVAEKRRRHSPPVPEAERTAGFAGWHSRGYLPHFDRAGVCQFITFRLADAFPASKRREWRQLLEIADERERLIHLEDWLDAGHGGCVLKRAGAAEIVQRVLQKFDGERYRLCGWVVMPNHVHVLIEAGGIPLARVLHSWKAFTALEINRLTGRSGRLWQVEYFDRYIRDGEHFRKALRYIENNPVKAGLVKAPEDWQWSSARTVDPAIDRSAGVHPARALAAVYAGEISSASPSEQQRAG
jgi:REP element-mobilizing transposase RayT